MFENGGKFRAVVGIDYMVRIRELLAANTWTTILTKYAILFDSIAARLDHEECHSIGLWSRRFRLFHYHTGRSLTGTTRYRGSLR